MSVINTGFPNQGIQLPFTVAIELVDKKYADAALAKNANNRKLRSANLRSITSDMLAGEWKLTHEGLAFNSLGQLIDGQHRLTAISQQDLVVPMIVYRYTTPVTPMGMPLDRAARRSASDIYEVERKTMDVAASLAGYVLKHSATPAQTNRAYEQLKGLIEPVIEAARSSKKIKSSASARAGMVVALMGTPPEHHAACLEQYGKYVNMDLDGLWSSTKWIIKHYDNPSADDVGKKEIFTRTAYAFSYENSERTSYKASTFLDKFKKYRETLLQHLDLSPPIPEQQKLYV